MIKTKEAVEVLVEIGLFLLCDELPYAKWGECTKYRQEIDRIIGLLQQGEEYRKKNKMIKKIIKEDK